MNATANAAIAATMSEDALLSNVLDAAKKLSWRTAHFRPARLKDGSWRTAVSGEGKGWPDLVLCNERMGEIVFAELKSMKGGTSTEQDAWLMALRACGQRAYVWTPLQWCDGTIQRVLEGVA